MTTSHQRNYNAYVLASSKTTGTKPPCPLTTIHCTFLVGPSIMRGLSCVFVRQNSRVLNALANQALSKPIKKGFQAVLFAGW